MVDNNPLPENGEHQDKDPAARNPDTGQPISQGSKGPGNWRDRLPAIIQQMPFPPFTHVPEEPNQNYQLIDQEDLQELAESDPRFHKPVIDRDIDFMDYELLRLFRKRDHDAKKQQVRYQRFQILYLTLAGLAGLVGSLQALTFDSNPDLMPVYSFIETLIALLAVFLATISGRQSPMQLWLKHRQRAEALRREYFRYLTRVPPYDTGPDYAQKLLLSRRAADINRGVDPIQSLDTANGG
jgi:hypothetical protein